MSKETKAPVAYVLSSAQTGSLAKAIAGSQDSRAQVASFRGAIASVVSNVKSLRGKPLPLPDAQRVAESVESELKERGYPAASIKVKKSRALSLALCAPILPGAFESCKELRESLADTLKFCAALKKSDYVLRDAVALFRAPRKVNYAASAAMHISAILGMKGRANLAFTSTKAKRALRDWAADYGIKISAKVLESVG